MDNIGGNVYNGRVSLRAKIWLNCNNMALNKGFLTFSFSLSLKLVFYLASVSRETITIERPRGAVYPRISVSREKASFKFSWFVLYCANKIQRYFK